jgi:uncharacterized membrane protein YesL
MNRPDWRESMSHAADLAVLGIAVALACLPIVTAGAVLTAASVAADRLCSQRALPAVRDLVAVVRRGLWNGMAATVAVLAVAGVLLVDARLLRTASIPGASAATACLAVVVGALLAVAAVTIVRIGQDPASGWRDALRWSLRLLIRRPASAVAILGTLAVPVVLALTIPVTALLLPGFVLFALHVVVRRADHGRLEHGRAAGGRFVGGAGIAAGEQPMAAYGAHRNEAFDNGFTVR